MSRTLLDAAETVRAGFRLRRALNGLYGLVKRRQTELGGITSLESDIVADGSATLEPMIEGLYYHGLRLGYAALPEDEEALRRFYAEQYEGEDDDRPEILLLLALFLFGYMVDGANAGGQIGLSLLGARGRFNLEDPVLLGQLEAMSQERTRAGGNLNLIDRTVDDLTRTTIKGRQDGTLAQLLSAMITVRAVTRSEAIAESELARTFAQGQAWVYQRNNVDRELFRTREDGDVCEICEPLNGQIFYIDDVPPGVEIPMHPRCRCYWLPFLEDWTEPEELWQG